MKTRNQLVVGLLILSEVHNKPAITLATLNKINLRLESVLNTTPDPLANKVKLFNNQQLKKRNYLLGLLA